MGTLFSFFLSAGFTIILMMRVGFISHLMRLECSRPRNPIGQQ